LAALAVAALLTWGNEAAAASLGNFALKMPESVAAANPETARGPLSLGVAVTLAIVPGFGLGHYYAEDTERALTFLVLDGTTTAVVASTFVLRVMSVAPAYTKVALIVFPAVFVAVKVIEAIDVADAVEVANNRTLRPVSLRHVSEHAPALALFRF
jgi:hypothetical protein